MSSLRSTCLQARAWHGMFSADIRHTSGTRNLYNRKRFPARKRMISFPSVWRGYSELCPVFYRFVWAFIVPSQDWKHLEKRTNMSDLMHIRRQRKIDNGDCERDLGKLRIRKAALNGHAKLSDVRSSSRARFAFSWFSDLLVCVILCNRRRDQPFLCPRIRESVIPHLTTFQMIFYSWAGTKNTEFI